MTDADAIWESKLSRLQDPDLEKMKPLAELMGELRAGRQREGESRSHGPGAQERAEALAEEGVQRVKWFTGLPPEAQSTLAVGAIAILVQPIFIVITFFLGKAQGRAQTRHERASDALVDAMREMRDVQIKLFMWSSMRKHDFMEREYRKQILESRQRLRDLVYNNAVWFDPKSESKLKTALRELDYRYEEHSNGIDTGDDDYATHTGERLNEWATTPFIQTQLDLGDEARRLIGSKRSWSLTWWGRPLAFFTRNTPFFPIVKWLRQHFAWLMAVPGVSLIAALMTLLLVRRLLAP